MKDKELKLMEKFMPLPQEDISVLKIMQADKEAHIHQDFFDKADGEERARIGKLMDVRFGINVSAD